MKAVKKMFVNCGNCGKAFDVVQVAKTAKGKELRCPHCKTAMGIINS